MQDDLMNDCLAGYRDGMKQADDEFIGWWCYRDETMNMCLRDVDALIMW